jgi:hypothetical protein
MQPEQAEAAVDGDEVCLPSLHVEFKSNRHDLNPRLRPVLGFPAPAREEYLSK